MKGSGYEKLQTETVFVDVKVYIGAKEDTASNEESVYAYV
jgi:hypothetical protein